MATVGTKTSYFIAKCDSIESLRKCINTSRWACRNRKVPPHPSELLTNAQSVSDLVVIIFSVNNCHGWHGYAEMASEVETPDGTSCGSEGIKTKCADSKTKHLPETKDNKCGTDEKASEQTNWNFFDVKWKKHFLNDFGERCLSSQATDNEQYTLTDGTPLNKTRNWQEVPCDIGKNLCILIDDFYEELKTKQLEKMKIIEENVPPPFFHSSDEVDLMNENWMKISEKITKELGNIIMACPFGSRRYNLHTPTSDMDMFLVYQAKTCDILGFNPPKQTLKSNERESCDFTIHEIFRFGELLMSGDHRCVETLFVTEDTLVHTSPAFQRLQQNKHLFVNSEEIDMVNVVEGQIGALKKRPKTLEVWMQDLEWAEAAIASDPDLVKDTEANVELNDTEDCPDLRKDTEDGPDLVQDTKANFDVNNETEDSPDLRKDIEDGPDLVQDTKANFDVNNETEDSPDLHKDIEDGPDLVQDTKASFDVNNETEDCPDLRKDTEDGPDLVQDTKANFDVNNETEDSPDLVKNTKSNIELSNNTADGSDLDRDPEIKLDVIEHAKVKSDITPLLLNPDTQPFDICNPKVEFTVLNSCDSDSDLSAVLPLLPHKGIFSVKYPLEITDDEDSEINIARPKSKNRKSVNRQIDDIVSDENDEDSEINIARPKSKNRKSVNRQIDDIVSDENDDDSEINIARPKSKNRKSVNRQIDDIVSDENDEDSEINIARPKSKKRKFLKRRIDDIVSDEIDEDSEINIASTKSKNRKFLKRQIDDIVSDENDEDSEINIARPKSKNRKSVNRQIDDIVSDESDEDSEINIARPKSKKRKFLKRRIDDIVSDEIDEDSEISIASTKSKNRKFLKRQIDDIVSDENDDDREINIARPKSKKSKFLKHRTETIVSDENDQDRDINIACFKSDNRMFSKDQMETIDHDEDDNVRISKPNTSTSKFEDDEIIRDQDEKEIYIKKYQPKVMKGKRCYDNRHACFYCGKIVLHINLHLKTHRNREEVKEILQSSHPNFTELRKKGDDKHNRKVIEKGKGELIVARRSREEIFKVSSYGPCPLCREWVQLKGIKVHYRNCAKNKLTGPRRKAKKRDLIVQSQILAGHVSCKSELVKKEVLPIMTDDEVSKTARTDPLIVALGESWLKRNVGNIEKRKLYASARMRLCGRLLQHLRKLQSQDGKVDDENQDAKDSEERDTSETNQCQQQMWDFLRPQFFNDVVLGALKCSFPVADDLEDLGAPSNAIKLKYDIQRLLNSKWAMIVMNEGFETKEALESKAFLSLMEVEWKEKVATTARAILNRRKYEEVKELPTPEDIEKLTKYLIETLKNVPLNAENFTKVIVAAQTRLLLYNKRRSGELEVIKLQSYASRSKGLDAVDESLAGDLSEVEKKLLETQDLMKVRGKRGRPVPVLIPGDTKEALAFLADGKNRKEAGITPGNPYLFPNSANNYARAYESLKKICSELNLTAPHKITSVSMRKYTATLTQMLNLDKNQMDWILNHLGHTKAVHKEHYRQMSGLLERTKVSKMLLVQDLNLMSKFKGKRLEEVDIRDIVFPDQEKTDDEPKDLKCHDKYLRDACGSKGTKQLQRMTEGRSPTEALSDRMSKLAYIIIRLLQNAVDVVRGGPIIVYRPEDSAERTMLMKIRQGTLSIGQTWDEINRLLSYVEAHKADVQDHIDALTSFLEEWLIQLRREQFA